MNRKAWHIGEVGQKNTEFVWRHFWMIPDPASTTNCALIAGPAIENWILQPSTWLGMEQFFANSATTLNLEFLEGLHQLAGQLLHLLQFQLQVTGIGTFLKSPVSSKKIQGFNNSFPTNSKLVQKNLCICKGVITNAV